MKELIVFLIVIVILFGEGEVGLVRFEVINEIKKSIFNIKIMMSI